MDKTQKSQEKKLQKNSYTMSLWKFKAGNTNKLFRLFRNTFVGGYIYLKKNKHNNNKKIRTDVFPLR